MNEDKQVEEQDLEELQEQAVTEQVENPTNETYSDGEIFEATEVPRIENDVEGDVSAADNVKEDAAEEIKQNKEEIAADVPKEEGDGAHASVRNAWSSGNGWGL